MILNLKIFQKIFNMSEDSVQQSQKYVDGTMIRVTVSYIFYHSELIFMQMEMMSASVWIISVSSGAGIFDTTKNNIEEEIYLFFIILKILFLWIIELKIQHVVLALNIARFLFVPTCFRIFSPNGYDILCFLLFRLYF